MSPRQMVPVSGELLERLRDIFPELPRYVVALHLDIPGRTDIPTLTVKFIPTLTTKGVEEPDPSGPRTQTFAIVDADEVKAG